MTDFDLTPVSTEAPMEPVLRKGIGLCLSGGGYRAMLFHLGVVWRLAELGYLGTEHRWGKHGELGSLQRGISWTWTRPASRTGSASTSPNRSRHSRAARR
jgi:NTE family protein